jgi:hypothetical protein
MTVTTEYESSLREKIRLGKCHVNGCNKDGHIPIPVTFATVAPLNPHVPGRHRNVQALLSALDCGEHRG